MAIISFLCFGHYDYNQISNKQIISCKHNCILSNLLTSNDSSNRNKHFQEAHTNTPPSLMKSNTQTNKNKCIYVSIGCLEQMKSDVIYQITRIR